MNIKVQYRSLTLVFESKKDLDSFADELEQENASTKVAVANQQSVTANNPTVEKQPETMQPKIEKVEPIERNANVSLSNFFKGLNDKTMNIIKALADAPEGLSDSELREKVGIESKLVFAGTMSAITKLAIRLGIDFDQVLNRTVTDNRNGHKKYHYALTESARKALGDNSPNHLF